jgi:phage gpG-like protein
LAIKLEFKVPRWDQIFKKSQRDIMLLLAASMQTNRAHMFDAEGADNGKPKWAPLKFRQGMILSDRGTLRQSMGPQNNGKAPTMRADNIVRFEANKASIGTKLAYARMMNDGTASMPDGVLRPVRAQALRFMGPGGEYMFRRSVRIPARNMDEITQQDAEEWSETIANYLSEILAHG